MTLSTLPRNLYYQQLYSIAPCRLCGLNRPPSNAKLARARFCSACTTTFLSSAHRVAVGAAKIGIYQTNSTKRVDLKTHGGILTLYSHRRLLEVEVVGTICELDPCLARMAPLTSLDKCKHPVAHFANSVSLRTCYMKALNSKSSSRTYVNEKVTTRPFIEGKAVSTIERTLWNEHFCGRGV